MRLALIFTLLQIFPTLDREVIASLFVAKNGDLEATIDTLLFDCPATGRTNSSPPTSARSLADHNLPDISDPLGDSEHALLRRAATTEQTHEQ